MDLFTITANIESKHGSTSRTWTNQTVSQVEQRKSSIRFNALRGDTVTFQVTKTS